LANTYGLPEPLQKDVPLDVVKQANEKLSTILANQELSPRHRMLLERYLTIVHRLGVSHFEAYIHYVDALGELTQ
jgi:hypothetical protein